MSNSILWMDGLAISLLWPMLWNQWLARKPNGLLRRLIAGLLSGLATFALLLACIGGGVLRFRVGSGGHWFWFFVSLLAIHLLGLIWIGRSRRQDVTGTTLSNFPVVALCLLLAVALGAAALLQMDRDIQTRCAIRSQQVQMIYLAHLPPLPGDEANAATMYPRDLYRAQGGRAGRSAQSAARRFDDVRSA